MTIKKNFLYCHHGGNKEKLFLLPPCGNKKNDVFFSFFCPPGWKKKNGGFPKNPLWCAPPIRGGIDLESTEKKKIKKIFFFVTDVCKLQLMMCSNKSDQTLCVCSDFYVHMFVQSWAPACPSVSGVWLCRPVPAIRARPICPLCDNDVKKTDQKKKMTDFFFGRKKKNRRNFKKNENSEKKREFPKKVKKNEKNTITRNPWKCAWPISGRPTSP